MTTHPHNAEKKHRTLDKAKRRLAARQNAFVEVSPGQHKCHMPGSMKTRKN